MRQIDAWIVWMTLAGLSPETIRVRRSALRGFAAFAADFPNASRDEVACWLATFAHPATRSTRLSYVRCFYQWALVEGLVCADPTARLPKVKVPRAVPRPIPAGELDAALRLAAPRERLWLELMAYAGLRVSEVAACRPGHAWQAVDGGWWLRIPRAKGGAEQQVPLPTWLAHELIHAPEWTVQRLAVYRGVKKLLLTVGSTSTPHAARHFYATAALRQTGNLRTVQQMMRHASPATTARYTLITSREVTAAAEALPRPRYPMSA